MLKMTTGEINVLWHCSIFIFQNIFLSLIMFLLHEKVFISFCNPSFENLPSPNEKFNSAKYLEANYTHSSLNVLFAPLTQVPTSRLLEGSYTHALSAVPWSSTVGLEARRGYWKSFKLFTELSDVFKIRCFH